MRDHSTKKANSQASNNQFTQSEEDTIQRCPHNRENPYAQISRELLRDVTISLQCYRLVTLLLSNSDGWIIRIPQLVHQLKSVMGRDAIYAAVNEAIENGYMRREEYIFQNQKRYRYFLSEFKNSFLYPDPQYTGATDTNKKEQEKEPLTPPSGEIHPQPRKAGRQAQKTNSRALGTNPRAAHLKENRSWAGRILERLQAACEKAEVDFKIRDDVLYATKQGSFHSGRWDLMGLIKSQRANVLETLQKLGVHIQ